LRCSVAVSCDPSREKARWNPVARSGSAKTAPTLDAWSTGIAHPSPCGTGQPVPRRKRELDAGVAASVSADPAGHVQAHVDGSAHVTLDWLVSTIDWPPAPTVTR